ncbi:DNA-directed RNA polymerase I subunit RPA2 [Cotesia glomerata]|uniref:DNA-directed RNA polymerase subunit beta n=1 Tax=Cotesia glomerata TaxID=32391 RepID=A0AAV7J1B8_COTGL|nr:DNA-directed RNA polymerase I subunit RPA2 [Cotesia glomerata]KAH0564449.1 hypothetical protein KQX54_012171 [Cotesia glomerata]
MLDEPKLTNLSKDFGKIPAHQHPALQALGDPHIGSFNYMQEEGFSVSAKDIAPAYTRLMNNDLVKVWINKLDIQKPCVPLGTKGVKDPKIYPSECRQKGSTYKGELTAEIGWSVNEQKQEPLKIKMGEIPIMVKSNQCNLNGMNPKQLVKHKELEQEWGGYFIVKGHERLIRMLQMNRRNYPIAIKRSGWKTRGEKYSDLGVSIRCVRDDNTATTNVLHYATNGSAFLMFSHRKVMFHVPVIMVMMALYNSVDRWTYVNLTRGREKDHYYCSCIQNMLRSIKEEGLLTCDDVKNYIGQRFRVRLIHELHDQATNAEVCDYLMQKCVLIHLDDPEDKFQLLVFMTQKLFALANNKARVEGADGVMMHECLLGGHLYLQILKEKCQTWLSFLKRAIIKKNQKVGPQYRMTAREMTSATAQCGNFSGEMENFLATGNVKTATGLGLMQHTGLTIVAENINRCRYMSHFRAIHRGSFFQEMRTTEARQLLPDAWGFICPVHTPDGAPCGLLNHLSDQCIVTKHPKKEQVEQIPRELVELGMRELCSDPKWENYYDVVVDGKVLGIVYDKDIDRVTNELRKLKIREKIPPTTEIIKVPKKGDYAIQYPGLFIFTGPARMMRPVKNLKVGKRELIGTFEQVYMHISITRSERHEYTTHEEISKVSFMSNIAKLIPWPDNNPSPRNMYQCQMGKQTMGTCTHFHNLQSECKLYRLQTPQTPLVRPVQLDNMKLDEFAMGTNAIVAVCSYTGYDMEDAMVINKASYERGLAHGSIYKSEFIDLGVCTESKTDYDKHGNRAREIQSFFGLDPKNSSLRKTLQDDGLPNPGTRICKGDPYYCKWDHLEQKFEIGYWKSKEDAIVDNVRMCQVLNPKDVMRACITFRVTRNPAVGDKFASRAGQKGICSMKFQAEDLPFSESGMIPDIMFNPHGFPSRMTIAMLIEFMAGKSAATHGLVHDATPFRFNEKDTAIDYFGRLLELGGFDYYGEEVMYSGTDGRMFEAYIYMGVIHYQRLRHMVEDKAQVRSTGPVDVLTQQPIKGRRRGGGVRFGEMERDALIAHGTSYLLRDRLFHCSDKSTATVCRKCGSLLGPVTEFIRKFGECRSRCKFCNDDKELYDIDVPYIFRYFVTELASLNIKVKFDFRFI